MQVRGMRAPLRLGTELSEGQVLELAAGDVVYLTGRLYTMRDQAHIKALQLLRSGTGLPFDLKGGTIYHCGPLMRGDTVVSAGPTTSMRMERSEPKVIARTGLGAIVGKGGIEDGGGAREE